MLSIYFLSKKAAIFQWDIYEEKVSLENKNAILDVLGRVQTKTLYLYDIRKINTEILTALLELIDINLFGNQLQVVNVNKNHPMMFKNLNYDFQIITVEEEISISNSCLQEKCNTNPKESPFIALGDCLTWDTQKIDNQYEVVEGSSVATIQELHKRNGDIAWSSPGHGKTLVCFNDLQQLKHAMNNNFLTGWAVFLK
ncbi:MAG: hypothetical protein H6850_02610 [Alphaproteobacteria bacterium]|nr:MAG: hypothetical protein H6850_02610 [Alphaproteobacteria bacterium]